MLKQIIIILIYCIFSHFVVGADNILASSDYLVINYEPFEKGHANIDSSPGSFGRLFTTVPLTIGEAFASCEGAYNFLEIIKKDNDSFIDYPWRRQFANKTKSAAVEFILQLGNFPAESSLLGYDVSRRNNRKNRYNNLAPLDEGRVKLEEQNEKNKDSYINASFVPGASLIPGIFLPDFIITQAPQKQSHILDDTMEDFWQMVWGKNICLIVMLTDFVEDNFIKANPYYPPSPDHIAHVYGAFVIGNNKISTVDDITICELSLMKAGEMRKIFHLQYKKWLDHACPPSALAQLKLVDNTMHLHSEAPASPILVHCSAGIGRSGAFVIVYAAILQIMTTGEEPEIQQMLINLRKCRAYNMVKYPGQYEKIFFIIEDFLNRKCTKS